MKLEKVMSLIVGKRIYVVDNEVYKFSMDLLELDITALDATDEGVHIHLTKNNNQKQRYEFFKEKGLCCACGCENDTDGVYCKMCRATRKFNKKEIRNMRYEQGLCTNCGSKKNEDDVNDLGNPFKTCKKCRSYFYQKNKEMRERK